MKKSVIAAIVIVAAFVGHADLLYWMVSDDIAKTAAEGGTFDYAALYAVSSTDSTKTALDTRTEGQVYTAYDEGIAFQYSGIEAYKEGYSFLIEILSGDSKGSTYSVDNYALLQNYIIRSGSNLPSSSFVPEGFGGGGVAYNVPEPTSGLLFLVGGMLLGLRRKRRV